MFYFATFSLFCLFFIVAANDERFTVLGLERLELRRIYAD